MYFGSKFVYNYSEEEEEEYGASDIEGALDDEDKSSDDAKSKGGAPARGRKRRWRRADTNVVCLKFDDLTSSKGMHTGDPVYCTGCAAIMSSISTITEQVWTCEFCCTTNTVDVTADEIPKKDDVTFMLQPSENSAASLGADKTLAEASGSLIVFCIDVSGSMGTDTRVSGRVDLGSARNRYQQSRDITLVSRLDAVKVAVTRQVQEIAETSPETRVALVTFATQVRAVGDGSAANPLIFHGGQKTKDEIRTMGGELPLPMPVAQTKTQLTDKVCDLQTQDMTALGPALLLSVAMASQVRGSKVIICTDGMANVGFGALSNYTTGGAQYDQATEFYSDIARYASENGVSISVITFEGTDCRLAELGHVAASTEGHVNIVDPMKLTEEFGNILIDRTVATNVTATFILHQGLYIRNEDNAESKIIKEFGNVSKDTEITFEYGIRRDKKKRSPDVSVDQSTPSPADEPPPVGVPTPPSNQSDPITAVQLPASSEPNMDTTTDDKTGSPTVRIEDASSTEQAAQPGTSAVDGPASCTGRPQVASCVDDLSELPFQLQVVYTDMEGAKAIRVVTQQKPVTKERVKAEENMRAKVLLTHGTKMNHGLALRGAYQEARMNARSNARFMKRNIQRASDQKAYDMYLAVNDELYDNMQQCEQVEKAQYGRTLSGSDDDEDDDDSQQKPKRMGKKKAVVQQRQQARSDQSSKTIFSNIKKAFMGRKDDSDDD